jgi:hypothetical protein
MRTVGGFIWWCAKGGDGVWAFRFTDLEGKRTQMEFAKTGDRETLVENTALTARSVCLSSRQSEQRKSNSPESFCNRPRDQIFDSS